MRAVFLKYWQNNRPLLRRKMTDTHQGHQIQVQLTIHQDGEDLRIDFPFDTQNDNIDTVVSELLETQYLAPDEIKELKAMIQEQINSANGSKKPGNPTTAFSSSFEPLPEQATAQPPQQPAHTSSIDSSEEEINDPEYKALVNEQKRELQALEARHLIEKQDLEKKFSKETAPSATVDDLIIFG